MKGQITIRKETKGDIKEIFEVNHIAFGQDNEAKLVDALRNNPTVFIPELSLVAIKNNSIVGHILFTKIKLINDNKKESESLALAPMAVKPEFQHKGIGGVLIKYGFDVAKKLGYSSVIVLGHKVFYKKFGFDTATKWNIKAPFELKDEENYMAIELVEGGLKDTSGTVLYPKEFEMV